MITSAEAEFDFLVAVCLGTASPECVDTPSAFDWQRLCELSSRHRVDGPVWQYLTTASDLAPPQSMLAQIEQARRQQAMRSLGQLAETMHLVGLLEASGISTIVLKGCALAAKLYAPKPELRHSIDIDLLVAPAAFAEAEAILLQEGYQRRTPGPHLPRSAVSMAHHLLNAYEYVDADRGLKVELHHRLLLDPYLYRVPFERLLANSESIAIGGSTVRGLGPLDLPVYLCCHAAGHVFFRLKWLADITRLFDGMGQEGVASTLDHARSLGCSRPVLVSLLLIEELSHRRYDVLDHVQRRSVAHLVRHAKAALLAGVRGNAGFRMSDVPADLGEMLYAMRLAENWRSRAFKVLQHMSNHRDLSTLQLGAAWSPLYALLGRPLALLRWLSGGLSLSRNAP